MTEQIRLFSAISDGMRICAPSQFQIRNWEKVVSAFLKLKASYCHLSDGELILESKPGVGTKAVIMIPKEVTA